MFGFKEKARQVDTALCPSSAPPLQFIDREIRKPMRIGWLLFAHGFAMNAQVQLDQALGYAQDGAYADAIRDSVRAGGCPPEEELSFKRWESFFFRRINLRKPFGCSNEHVFVGRDLLAL